MSKTLRLTFSRGDFLVILLVILLAVGTMLAYLPRTVEAGHAVVQVYLDGKKVEELPLSENRELTISGDYDNLIRIQNSRACIAESDCPGTDCVHSGWINAPGRSIVCLPNRVEIRIAGLESDVDFVVR